MEVFKRFFIVLSFKAEEMELNNGNCDSDDDTPRLSSEAMAALRQFLSEQTQTHVDADSVSLVSEDWRLSQFWYDPQTAETVSKEVLTLCDSSDSLVRVACVACPTLYAYLKVLLFGFPENF